jgi:hypothetical protein
MASAADNSLPALHRVIVPLSFNDVVKSPHKNYLKNFMLCAASNRSDVAGNAKYDLAFFLPPEGCRRTGAEFPSPSACIIQLGLGKPVAEFFLTFVIICC